MSGRPWTRIRELRGGVDSSDGAVCGGSQGSFHLECPKPVEGVQYTTSFGDPQFYCEEHALAQFEWDVNLYDSEPSPHVHQWTDEERRQIERALRKGKPREPTTDDETF